jgi:hypothetical protein
MLRAQPAAPFPIETPAEGVLHCKRKEKPPFSIMKHLAEKARPPACRPGSKAPYNRQPFNPPCHIRMRFHGRKHCKRVFQMSNAGELVLWGLTQVPHERT